MPFDFQEDKRENKLLLGNINQEWTLEKKKFVFKRMLLLVTVGCVACGAVSKTMPMPCPIYSYAFVFVFNLEH